MPRTRSPEKIYYAEQSTVGKLYARLDTETAPAARADLLYNAADRLAVMATVVAQFDNTIDADDGYTPAEWDMWTSRLARLVANTESALAGLPTNPNADPELENRAVEVLARLNTTAEPGARAGLVDELYGAVVGVVGEQAGECLARIARSYRHQQDLMDGKFRLRTRLAAAWSAWRQPKSARSGVS